MNIIIEGCDGTGKSTLADYLCNRFNLYYWHENSPRTLDEYKQMLTPGGVVFDRFCFGQFVYNTPEQRKLSLEQLQELVQYFKTTSSLLIYVDCSSETIARRLINRGEGSMDRMEEMIRWIKNIRGTYRQILRDAKADYIDINGETGLCLPTL